MLFVFRSKLLSYRCFYWNIRQEFNLRPKDYVICCLHLRVAVRAGLEPAWEGLEIPYKSFLRQPHKIIIKLNMVVGFEPTRPSNSLPGLVNVDFNHSDHRLQYRTLLRQRVSLSAIPWKEKQDSLGNSSFMSWTSKKTILIIICSLQLRVFEKEQDTFFSQFNKLIIYSLLRVSFEW